jgi:hypothetical protein
VGPATDDPGGQHAAGGDHRGDVSAGRQVQDGYAEHRLFPGQVVWFTPGVVHRLADEGDLEVLVVMSNAGLPEAGDAVLTFPDEVLADPDRCREAAALPAQSQEGPDEPRVADAARR